jgi:hypothetical protein
MGNGSTGSSRTPQVLGAFDCIVDSHACVAGLFIDFFLVP